MAWTGVGRPSSGLPEASRVRPLCDRRADRRAWGYLVAQSAYVLALSAKVQGALIELVQGGIGQIQQVPTS